MKLLRGVSVLLTLFAVVTTPSRAHSQNASKPLPDLRIDAFRVRITSGDWQSNRITGVATITTVNYSYMDIRESYLITVFDDVNMNDELDVDTDTILGERKVSCCDPWLSGVIDVDFAGTVRFRGAMLSVSVDSRNDVNEDNEQNNYEESDPECVYVWTPLSKKIVGGRELWRWIGGKKSTPSRRVQTSPFVFDTNGDGVSEIIFASHENRDVIEAKGPLREISGLSGEDVFVSTQKIDSIASLAVADMDRDGKSEVVAVLSQSVPIDPYQAIVFDGASGLVRKTAKFNERMEWGGASIADIDGDGLGDIVLCATVIDYSGKVLWRGTGGRGQVTDGCHSSVADIDMDGSKDVLAGNTLYDGSGNVLWRRSDLLDGLTAIGNFDLDLLPEIVLVTSESSIYLLNSDGSTVWGPVEVPGRASNVRGGGLPTVADFDGDGRVEIGVANNAAYTVFDTDGKVLWSKTTSDPGGRTGAAAFDFNADGAYELIYGDEQYIRIYSGVDGSVLWSTKRPAGTGFDMPIVADVDRDSAAEIFTGLSSGFTAPESITTPPGVYSFGSNGSAWGWARSLWNQLSYHVNNIDDAGVVPIFEAPSWLDHNTYRAAVLEAYQSGVPDITVSKISVDRIEGSNNYNVSFRLGNGGRLGMPNGITVAAFDGDPAAGGVQIGSTVTRVKIRYNRYIDSPEEGDRPIVWTDPTPGEHTLYVVADYGDILTECRLDNNIHWLRITFDGTSSVPPTPSMSSSPPVTVATPLIEVTPTRMASARPDPRPDLTRKKYIPLMIRSRSRASNLHQFGE